MTCPAEDAIGALIAGLTPDPLLPVDKWADQFRVLSTRASSEPGPWRTSRTPYLAEVMRSLSRSEPVQEVCVVAGAQLGKTECGINWIGATIDTSPGPMLCVQPTVDLAKRFSRQRVTPLIEEAPRLKAKIRPARERDSGNTVLSKEYPGGIMMITGANSAAGLRSMPIRDLFMDEIDAYPGDVDGEGDPVDLAMARTRTFTRKKVLLTSTPTLASRSRIWSIWEQSDQRVFQVACPDCGHRQVLEWSRIHYDPKDLRAGATLACEGCGVLIEERHKPRMLAGGQWKALNPGAKIHGYHINSLYSPLGWFSWADAAELYEKAKDDEQRLRVFTNTVLALPWQENGEAPDWEALYRRRDTYQRGKVPAGGVVVTAGVDIQRDRIELEIVAWGQNLESWSVDYVVLPGDTAVIQIDPVVPCVWRDLAAELGRSLPTAVGASLKISKVAVDSGDQSQTVYSWVRSQHDSRIMATKGRDNLTSILGIPTPQDVTIRGKKVLRGIRLWPLGVSVGKQELYGWLRQPPPLNPGDPFARGFCHFPEYPEEHFQGLTAEELRQSLHRGFPVYRWEKVRPRNEQLDCRIMARGAAAALGIDRWPEEEWRARQTALEGTAVPATEHVVAVAEPDPQEPEAPSNAGPELHHAPEQRPVTRGRSKSSGWLQGGSGRRGRGWLGR
ncbi:phage terminase large subunit family protein [Synechococcus sp. 1G10]|uniref:phage terminase large subunit family protein n=1 Tax=Synechococcus sp. 1G10 TaxID=2025605 RepID=UPI000B9889E7|nr:phage terminase large subunit family protein [Synechococcus sp. 1G10]